MNSIPEEFQPFVAVVMGTGIGLLLCVGMQKVINHQQRQHCNQASSRYVLVEGRSFIGDTVLCIDRTYTRPMAN